MAATKQQYLDLLSSIDNSTNSVADELARLRDLIQNAGLSEADEAEILGALTAQEEKLRGIAATPENPVPGENVRPLNFDATNTGTSERRADASGNLTQQGTGTTQGPSSPGGSPLV